jgi:hypothetical protein
MKKLIVALTALLISFSLTSQNFISENKQWNVFLNSFGGLSTEIFSINGDSSINNVSYKKIYVSYDSLKHWQYQGLLREDSSQVYFVGMDSVESLLYDFSLHSGDSVWVKNVFCYHNQVGLHVDSVDTIIINGKSHKRLFMNGGGYLEEWISDIGSSSGPLYSSFMQSIVCPYWQLGCYYENDKLVYSNPQFSNCFYTTIMQGSLETELTLYPNPADNLLHIESRKHKLDMIRIYDLQGKQLIQSTQNPIDISFLTPGIYFVLIRINDKEVSGRFVKE